MYFGLLLRKRDKWETKCCYMATPIQSFSCHLESCVFLWAYKFYRVQFRIFLCSILTFFVGVSAAGGMFLSSTLSMPALQKMYPKCLCSVHVRKLKYSCGYFFPTKPMLIPQPENAMKSSQGCKNHKAEYQARKTTLESSVDKGWF